ncbi:mannose-6-phosphate isomerase-like protein (cupin superfamily) [Sphingomonas sp. BE138]|uniref:cupin domain-containing protein n=1 Tax=Sphingomonas sp. BE138 TaxID=2817845 RepID=UPI002854ACCA|nr:cupin domain-containing protein [Sphingomonas sp. BE138]MDR6787170.1 mannose-6-phosphate isomerase-like protein (cupin superfamily) [Sphingomonas sp. BE138]
MGTFKIEAHMQIIGSKIVAALLLSSCAGAVVSTAAVAQSKVEKGSDAAGDFASGPAVREQLASMLAEMKPGQGFAWRPLVQDGPRVAAIEVWKTPGRPAVHPTEAEYAIVLEGAGTLLSGGKLISPVPRREGLVEGDRIEGGTARSLKAGDVFLVPAGVPHWFGITGDHLVLLGTKMPGGQ